MGAVLGGHYLDLHDAALEVAYLEGQGTLATSEDWRTVALALLDLAKRQDDEREAAIDASVRNLELANEEELAEALEQIKSLEQETRDLHRQVAALERQCDRAEAKVRRYEAGAPWSGL